MKRIRIAVLATLALAFTGTLQANEELATKSGCLACHKIDAKVLGPSFKDVAAKYKGDKKAEAMLIDKVKKGGMGTWGPIAMPPNGHVKDDDIKALVKWVLALK
jgi:cytochrome c